ncbi:MULTISPECIES: hypothetical protein [unclassified Mesorhizobium]|uniref:hypothetical protein n=1 Tax=unclassified Mesorhizobium TaxID=325217 RepID=UPI003338CB0F
MKFRAYDEKSTQPRDPIMVKEEGETNVSAHRGYLDIVVTDFDIAGLGAPPVFEAEWIQDGAPTHDYDTFTTFSGSIFFDNLIPVWADLKAYGFNYSDIALSIRSRPAGNISRSTCRPMPIRTTAAFATVGRLIGWSISQALPALEV